MENKIVLHRPGQKKLARYRHTQSCIRLAGFAPGKEREKADARCRVLAILYVLIISAGIIAVFR